MKLMSMDFESSIGDTIHGPDWRDPGNDIFTQIWATNEEWVGIVHFHGGSKRKLHKTIADELFHTDLLIGHNIGFDLGYVWHTAELREYILKGGKIWDTQLAEYLLTGQQHQFASLAELQLKHLGEKIKPSRISHLYKKGIGADKIVNAKNRCPRLFSLYEEYCKSDGATPISIYKKQHALATKKGMLPLIELYNDYLLAIIQMSTTGINLDVPACEDALRDMTIKSLDYLKQAQDIVKEEMWVDPRLPEFNINSPDHKSAVLFGGQIKVDEKVQDGLFKNGNPRFRKVTTFVQVKGFGVPPSVSTPAKKEGLYSTDDKVMKKILAKTKNYKLKEYCELQKKAMMHKKAAKTYCQAFIDRNVNGILYANFNNTLTVTSRLSSSSPNMQNISKRNEFGEVLHRLFIAPPGWKAVSIDFSQLEIWVLAWLSGDEQLIEDLLSGIDLHIVRLQYYNTDKTYDELYQLCKVQKDEYWDKQRSYAKAVSYQMAYGAMPKSVSESTGIDLDIVEAIFQKEAERYPKAANFGNIVKQCAEESIKFSREVDIPAANKRGKDGAKFSNGIELLPIFDKNGEISYTEGLTRLVGYYQSALGSLYHFSDTGRAFRGEIKRGFSFTQTKNYPMQGGASNIQGMTTAALLKTLITKSDRIKMINEVHDSKWFLVREDVLEPCLRWLKETIEDVPKIMLERFGVKCPFKFPVDIEVGSNFADLEKYNFKQQERTNVKTR